MKCPYCNSTKERKNGRYKDGTQRYFCMSCKKIFRGDDRESLMNALQKKAMNKSKEDNYDDSIFWKDE